MEIPNEIHAIARIITKNLRNVYFAAVPYLTAMHSIHSINDYYGDDRGETVVRYFLNNASNWRREVAKQVKTKLKELLEEGC